ncbi:MAG: hypothetical protein WDN01_04440 [Rhizomicrobium sp.]
MSKSLISALVLLSALSLGLSGCEKKPQPGDEFLGRWVSPTHSLELDIARKDDKYLVHAKSDGGLLHGDFPSTYEDGKLNPHNMFGDIVYDKNADALYWAGTHLKHDKK